MELNYFAKKTEKKTSTHAYNPLFNNKWKSEEEVCGIEMTRKKKSYVLFIV